MSRSWGITRRESHDVLVPNPYKRDNNWKRNLHKEEEETVSEVTKVFVIINEWTTLDDDTSSEVVGGKFFLTEDAAWEALDLVAEAHDVDLDPDETSFTTSSPKKSGLASDEYRIEELVRD